MITLMEMLRGHDPKGGNPLTRTELYAANLIGPKEAERIRIQQKREDFLARKHLKEDLAMDVAALARGEKPRQRYANGVPTENPLLLGDAPTDTQAVPQISNDWSNYAPKNT